MSKNVNKVPIVFIADNNYAVPTAVAISSLIENMNEGTFYDIHVICVEVDSKGIQSIKTLADDKASIIILDFKNKYDSLNIEHPHVSKAALFKFDIQNLFPQYEKVLYLDGDILVQGDLSDLYNTELRDFYVAAAQDMTAVKKGMNEIVGVKKYFNSGVMLLNLEKMRKDNITEKLLQTRKERIDFLTMDQDVFNYTFEEEVIWIEPKYNAMIFNLIKNEYSIEQINDFYQTKFEDFNDMINDALILHLTNNEKPWLGKFSLMNGEWFKYFKKNVAINFPEIQMNKTATFDVEIRNLQNEIMLEKKEAEIESMRKELYEIKKGTGIDKVENELNSIKDELEMVKIELAKVFSSREWRTVLILRKGVSIFIPKGSKRRKIFVSVVRFIKSPLKYFRLMLVGIAAMVYNFLNFIIQRKRSFSSVSKKKRILIDCSFVYKHPELNTGIQRVVKNILKNVSTGAEKYNIEIITVVMLDKYLIAVDLQKRRNFLFKENDSENIILKTINRIKIYSYVFNNVTAVNKGDIFFLADSVWHYDISDIVKYVKDRKGVIIAIMYDLIPVNYPQFCDNSLVTVFNKFFSEFATHFDGFVSISKTVMNDLQEYISIVGLPGARYYFDYFVLGSDFKKQEYTSDNVRKEIINLYQNKSVYLTVSTIEPRKNHVYLIDSFEKLWGKGIDAKLCIIGRVGWKTEELIARIKNHKEYNNKLFMFNDATDAELHYCYNKSKMLVFASFVEGFGLPIVESLNNGLPVLASDIPIHREVGEIAIEYFNLNDTEDLANKIEFIEKNGIMQKIDIKSIKTKTWSESSAELLDKVMKISDEINRNRKN